MRAMNGNKSNRACHSWKKGTLEPKQMNLFSDPNVFTFAIHWVETDDVDRDNITKVFKFITPLIDTTQFMKIESKDVKKNTYVLRGFISYYGKHYMAYFYSEKFDYWVHFNDSKISEIGKKIV